MKAEQAVWQLRDNINAIKRQRDYHLMDEPVYVDQVLAAVAEMLEAADIIGENEDGLEYGKAIRNQYRNELRQEQRQQLQKLISELRGQEHN